ncbi:MAG: helix-turn-helix domain-containing protein [Furfurilactobacillus sp.]|uniref:helix-turn-helix domain-containing protein n=1 Tax=Furfurilactobacillus TaxID=2767882 RepID=UPI001F1E0BB3|nr:helix-turn-helix domain-containing protein [Furfurilactobacillus sp.]MCF6420359.1 helix-turn-helix domain-containing protein [Furfurilactobacillus milii]MCH4012430.1 helix-turn-helix domain-containing protein [Furfurilactobacillus sp.]MCH4038322.1 helix-turn-helix domain-containing protein [Furfurilactobacillus sp.]MCH4115041.1 helix-turn-helix domain-containing protein [Furfurilactobacillus sp.]MCH4133904.1 helix-turn-helix domain-containing protein [Furfurilactobacillus sp.]
MDRTELLNQGDRQAYRILESIYLADGQTNRAKLMKTLGLSPATLSRHLQKIMEDLRPDIDDGALTLTFDQTHVMFAMQGKMTLDGLMFDRQVLRSDMYQIYLYLYQHEFHFQAWQLANELHLSEKTTARKVTKANGLLKEFGLTIYRGELKGTLFQVTWFYYKLFRELHVTPKQAVNHDELIKRLTESGLRIDESMTDRLTQWLSVMDHVQVNFAQFSDQVSALDEQLTDGTKLKAVVDRTALQLTDSERENLTLFLLLHCGAVIADTQLDDWIGITRSQNRELYDNLRRIQLHFAHVQDIQQIVHISVAQLFSLLVVPMIGIGSIDHFDDLSFDHALAVNMPCNGAVAMARLKATLLETTTGTIHRIIDDHWRYLSQYLLPFYALLTSTTRPTRHIGLALGTSRELTALFAKRLINVLEPAVQVAWELYDERHHYDLIVMNEQNRQTIKQNQSCYEISALGNENDLKAILQQMIAG